MARAITKSMAASIINGFDALMPFESDENGMPKPNVRVECGGVPSPAKAQRLLESFVCHKNVMVLSVDTDETKLSLPADVFISHSNVCDDEKSYGHDFVVQTFKVTYYQGFSIVPEKGMQPIHGFYDGATTPNKLLSYVRATHGKQAVVTGSQVLDERRYMSKQEYVQLASKYSK